MKDPLMGYYERWAVNCEESARWLREGDAYEAWCRARGMTPIGEGEREEKAKRYEERAKVYRAKLGREN